MYRSHHCGQLRSKNIGERVVLSGWMATKRDFGGMTFIDLRDRYGITQLIFNMETDEALCLAARQLHREDVIQIHGDVRERSNKNPDIPTGDVEVVVSEINVLSRSKLPPFTIENDTDGGDELRMKYRYLDLRRPVLQEQIQFRSKLTLAIRKYMDQQQFLEIETPVLIKSTPEGARDFVVPSRLNPGQFYALPQSPQTFKQLFMVAGMDRYFQIVKCFRDEDLRADRQPEFTQVDCEMAFVHQEDVLQTFEGLTRFVFREMLSAELPEFQRITYDDAIRLYGSDKPDTRFDMQIIDFTDPVKGHGFKVFDQAEFIGGLLLEGKADEYSNKNMKEITTWVQRPQVGAKGLVYAQWKNDDTIKSSVGKFYPDDVIKSWFEAAGGQKGDILFLMSGEDALTRTQIGTLRLELGRRHELISPTAFKPLWVVDFPLLEWDEETQRFYAMHHPFTAPKTEDIEKMNSDDRKVLESIRADAYDLVINGAEIGGGSIRIYDRALQEKNFALLQFTPEEAESQFGFLMSAFEYGAPPHGGIAFGLDRLCAVMKGKTSIRDFIAFPKNNMGRDIMIDAPAKIDEEQLKDLSLRVVKKS
ncbi:aspartate--tRNA ligase [Membranicola marinus]|uniref:Aspartate--tRNA ligase n=1 Tax=Membranihabitans marinus TaxID=1227546 RepID=A0A953HU61_9BACT|nr:aspartate--tRNA ligase [Membranihabitans marinus]MBY5958375.1 aspartate--tRNA ligase [Membranihabitans marinus]